MADRVGGPGAGEVGADRRAGSAQAARRSQAAERRDKRLAAAKPRSGATSGDKVGRRDGARELGGRGAGARGAGGWGADRSRGLNV
jgi:hypothetical protein